jgi:hypothetical protein
MASLKWFVRERLRRLSYGYSVYYYRTRVAALRGSERGVPAQTLACRVLDPKLIIIRD